MKTILSERIKIRRKELHMSQEKLADLMSLPKTTISSYEQGTAVKDDRLMELATVLKSSPNWLLGYEENAFISEMCDLLRTIDDEKIQKLLLIQTKAVAATTD